MVKAIGLGSCLLHLVCFGQINRECLTLPIENVDLTVLWVKESLIREVLGRAIQRFLEKWCNRLPLTMREDEMVVRQADIVEEIDENAIIVQKATSAIGVWEDVNRNAGVIHGFVFEIAEIVIDTDIVNLLLSMSLVFAKYS